MLITLQIFLDINNFFPEWMGCESVFLNESAERFNDSPMKTVTFLFLNESIEKINWMNESGTHW